MVFSGEARIIRGRSHRVRRMRGVFKESVRVREVMGAILLRRGTVSRVRTNAVFKDNGVLSGWRARYIKVISDRIMGTIQAVTGCQLWAPKARVLCLNYSLRLVGSWSSMGGCCRGGG